MGTYYLRAPSGKVYDPLPSQAEFHAAEEKFRVYIGGVGAGKSLANAVECFLTAMEYPGSVGLLGRWSHGELRDTTWETLKRVVPQSLVISECCSPQKTQMVLRAPGGKVSKIHGSHLANWKSLTSLNLDWFGVDEITELPNEKTWKQLEARLRGDVGPHRGWGSGTPAGHDWVWQLFVRKGFRGYRVVKAPTSQNTHNPPSYEQDLRRSAPEEWRRRFLDAEFDVWEGQILHHWDERVHVIDRFQVPDHWPRFLAIDPGLSDPTAALLFATDEEGFIYVTDEFYRAGLTIDEQARAILAMVGDVKLVWSVIDPSVRDRLETTGKSRLQMYRDAGIPNLSEANNRVLDSIAWLEKHLLVDPNRMNPVTERLGAPGLFVFRNCIHLREEIPGWIWGQNGKPKDGNDHCFVAGTLVQTPSAAVPIEAVKPGDLVMTRQGARRVLAVGTTGNDVPVFTVTFSNGATLTGTDNHPIWSPDRGRFVPLTSLRYGDTALLWEENERPSTECITTDTQMQRREREAVYVVNVCAAGRQRVYNLQVSEVPEYYANGILVHNSIAALRYGMMRRPHAAEPVNVIRMRPSAQAFWDQIASEASGSWGAELPLIGAGRMGGLR